MGERASHRVTGKIIIRATITNTSPILIGKGPGDAADIEMMLLPDGKPYIPASSLAGGLRSQFYKRISPPLSDDEKIQAEKFWGSDDSKQAVTFQSHIRFNDLTPLESTDSARKIVTRDGVKISYSTGTAEEGAKYDYQLTEAGVSWGLEAEVTIRNGMSPDSFKFFTGIINAMLADQDFRIGAFSNTGFGAIECTGLEAGYFDFTQDDHRSKWFEYLETGSLPDGLDAGYEPKDIRKYGPSTFRIEADFRIKGALILGSYGISPEEPDKSHLKTSMDNTIKPVLTGKSIKGALRHRAVRILNTLGIPDAEKRLESLMGWVETDRQGNNPNACKSRLRMEEVIIDEVEEKLVQNRIRINRFTGGTMNGALFNSEPVWAKEAKKHVTIILTLPDYADWEATLLLQLLKDLWTGDLPIGGEKNIGRGVLTGEAATILFKDGTVTFKRNGEKGELAFTTGDIKDLAPFNISIKEQIAITKTSTI